MASRKETEIKKELGKALSEVGIIEPWYEKKFKAWMFSHPLYPVECEGNSAEEVLKKYPKYLEVFIEHRLKGKIGEINEKKTKGKAGMRIDTTPIKELGEEPTTQIRVPVDIAQWLKQPGIIQNLREVVKAYKHV